MTNFFRNFKSFAKNRIPGQLVIQITNRCNAQCPQCGMRVSADFARATLARDDVKRMLDAAAVQGVQAVSFTGGEPLLFVDMLCELIAYAGKAGIAYIRTGTNGFLFRDSRKADFEDRVSRLADRLAATPLRNFWISLDSVVPEVHETMRGLSGVVGGIEKALPIFHERGLFPSANLGINRRVGAGMTSGLRPEADESRNAYLERFYQGFQQSFDKFYRLVAGLGFTIVNTCYPMSISPSEETQGLSAVYAATAQDDIVRFSQAEKAVLYKALRDTIERHRHRLRIFTPLSSLEMLCRQYARLKGGEPPCGCRGGVDFFFVDAQDGNTYPCGYRGQENLGPFDLLDIQARAVNGACLRCDWECFRDPSELCAPFLNVLNRPLALAKRFKRDRGYLNAWLGDIRYYLACDLFDGRKPVNLQRLAQFKAMLT